MTDAEIDYAAVFQALPGMVALLTPDLVYADADEEFLRMSGRTREQVVGRFLFDVFPDNPHDPAATGMRNLETSLRRVLSTGERDAMALQRYDVESTARPESGSSATGARSTRPCSARMARSSSSSTGSRRSPN